MADSMGAAASDILIPVDDYLAGELLTEVRHEYLGGRVYAMGGASARHNKLSLNIATALHTVLADSSCEVFMADMKVRLRVGAEEMFFYPDVMVCCEAEDREEYFRTRPCLIVEVLSPSTERIDRHEKLLAYCRIESLREYLLVDQERRELTLHRRRSGWVREIFHDGDTLPLECAALELTTAAVYAKSGVA